MTPGTYLRKRREAAGISIDQAATVLATLPIATANFETARRMLTDALTRAESDLVVLALTMLAS